MTVRNRSNALALAVLICLYERPMHPYEIATTLRQRNQHESVKLNYGSLYGVVESLKRRGLIKPAARPNAPDACPSARSTSWPMPAGWRCTTGWPISSRPR